MTRIVALLATGAVIAGVGVGTYLAMSGTADGPFADCRRAAVAGGSADIGGPFTLTDASGAQVTSDALIDKPTLVYFGYSFCPDVCPVDLSRNGAAADILAERGIEIGQVFVTIDPERDTPEVVGDYAEALHPDLVGLTGSPDDIAAAADAYRVFYRKAAGGDPDYYLMDHSTFSYLVAPGHPFLEFYGSDVAPAAVADSVACFAGKL